MKGSGSGSKPHAHKKGVDPSRQPKSLDQATAAEMREFTGEKGFMAARWCGKCDQHYRFCKCAEPLWRVRAHGYLHAMPGEPGAPKTLTEFILKLKLNPAKSTSIREQSANLFVRRGGRNGAA